MVHHLAVQTHKQQDLLHMQSSAGESLCQNIWAEFGAF